MPEAPEVLSVAMEIDVVLPCLNEAGALPWVLSRMPNGFRPIVADNGSNWFLSGAPDSRWSDDDLSRLKIVRGSDFEVVKLGELGTKH